ncbi:nephrin-like [Bicyclus anynana]|uniref:Nephrin-like n=1 Tax=Bicyclus anynana TaxID=110368 RepID=A0A6J1NM87_BICAN|nr:nephrin-like [Bicyclus anynana]XP_023946117.1 nephrin-like [Bicyclus anynana]
MRPVWYTQRTLLAFLMIAVSTSPSATQSTILAGSPLSSVTGTVTRVSSVVGGEADLSCDSRPPQRNDSLLLVVWYRDDNPVYSYDTRVPGPTGHWSDDMFGDRARWFGQPTSALRVRDVQARDRAIYRCRVDFQVSPTRNYRIALDVIELPSKPVIFDEFGKEISGTAGPYNEGGDFKLICSVNGGNPTPRVQWLQGDTVLSTLGASELQPAGSSRSLTLTISNATRAHLSSVYTCTADNTPLSPPLRATVRVDLYLRPLSVEILSREQPLSVGRQAELWCKSTGARPPAIVTWWLGGKKLDSITKQQDLEDRNETQSLLQWTPLKEHNGKVLTCRAEHSKFNTTTIESKLPLNIYYVPVATMHLGAKMNPNDIEEGDDVYFGCEVDANPPAYKVVWEHNGVLLQHNPSNGVILTGNTNLALRNVSRLQAGAYTCTASNVEGDGKSPPLRMQVVYRPICRKREIKMIGAALQEPSRVECDVDAFPPPDTFEWTLNSSAGPIKVNPDRFTVDAKIGKSVLTYIPVSDIDYGTLLCRATNLAGHQISPCVYTLLPATRPDPPSNCSVYNLTDDSLDLTCLAGYEGGLQCTYVAEVWANEGLVTNSTNKATVWNLRRLGAKRHLKLVVYAANARGRSEHVSFTVETAPRLAPRTEAQEAWEVNWAVGGVLGAALTVAIILCLALIATRLRPRSRDYEVTMQSTKNQKAALQKRCSPDDRNPDLIPLSKGIDCPPDPPQYSTVVAKSEAKNSVSSHSLARTQSPTSPVSSNTQHELSGDRSGVNGTLRSHREVVTTRTPLLAAHQESCV